MAKIFVATPMYGGMCAGVYVQSLLNLVGLFSSRGHQVSCAFMFNESLITRGRNNMAHQFLKTDNDYLFWIDADIRFRAEDALKMLECDLDIIGGIYPKKEINWEQVRAAAAEGKERLQNYTGSFVVNLPYGSTNVVVRQDQPCEVMALGTGFMLVKRRVFEKLAKHVKTFKNDMSAMQPGEEIKAFFNTPIEKESGRFLSEDYDFCVQWRKRGGKVYAAPWCQLGHMGSYLFEGALIPTAEPTTGDDNEPAKTTRRRKAVVRRSTGNTVGDKVRRRGDEDNKRKGNGSSKNGNGKRQQRSTSSR